MKNLIKILFITTGLCFTLPLFASQLFSIKVNIEGAQPQGMTYSYPAPGDDGCSWSNDISISNGGTMTAPSNNCIKDDRYISFAVGGAYTLQICESGGCGGSGFGSNCGALDENLVIYNTDIKQITFHNYKSESQTLDVKSCE